MVRLAEKYRGLDELTQFIMPLEGDVVVVLGDSEAVTAAEERLLRR